MDALLNMGWHLQDAKNQFSKVVQKAKLEGPQTITLRGERAVIVVSAEEYDALTGNRPNIVEDLLSSPNWDDHFVEAVNTRDKQPSRMEEF